MMILTSVFLCGITAVFILIVFRKSFKSLMPRPAVKEDSSGSQRLEKDGITNSKMDLKDRPFGGMCLLFPFLLVRVPFDTRLRLIGGKSKNDLFFFFFFLKKK